MDYRQTRLGRADRWKAVSTAAHRTPTTHCVIDAAFKEALIDSKLAFPVVLSHNTSKINSKKMKRSLDTAHTNNE